MSFQYDFVRVQYQTFPLDYIRLPFVSNAVSKPTQFKGDDYFQEHLTFFNHAHSKCQNLF